VVVLAYVSSLARVGTHPQVGCTVTRMKTDENGDVWRWFDHNGDVIAAPATAAERATAYRWDDRRTHWVFGAPSAVAQAQAITLCGKRALEVPGRGDVDCPECIEARSEAGAP